MEDRLTGIIIKQTDYKDNDLIIHVLLENGKKVSLICRGVKKITSKNAMSISPFLTSEFIFNYEENKSIFNLRASVVKKNRKNIGLDLIKMALAGLMGQMIDAIILDDEYSLEDTYFLLDFCLDKLNDDQHDFLAVCFFIAKFLGIIGIKPYTDGCVFDDIKQVVGISVKDGGFVCRKCKNKTEVYHDLDESKLKNFRMINKADYENYDALLELSGFDYVDLDILIMFYIHHTGVKLTSYAFLKKIL